VLSADKVATGTLHDVYLKHTVRLRIDGYEPGGREFESLRARQYNQSVSLSIDPIIDPWLAIWLAFW